MIPPNTPAASVHRLPYRREVDGLRAVAVLPVILFHAGFAAFGGGYVGVDVFFVISGYLITSIILAEHTAGTFTLARFYERRARRILPALFLVIAACVPPAWLLLGQREWLAFSRSVAAVAVFASNILFWRETNYFDTATELKPLIHTWSLAVEEQYYVLYPLCLAIAWRLGLAWITALVSAAAVISLLAAHVAVAAMPAAAFYLLPTRGWELAIGALAALVLWRRSAGTSRAFAEAASAAGLVMIAISVAWFSQATPFPSIYALLPTGGAALIILYASPRTAAGRILGSTPLVGIGLISYSAYLWHQPLFAFARHAQAEAVSTTVLLSLAALSLGLAYVSWRFVEQPFRNPARINRRTLISSAAGGTVIVFLIGLTGMFFQPPRRVLDDLQQAATPLKTARPCTALNLPEALQPHCRAFGAGVAPDTLLMGDSHAEAIQFALEEALVLQGRSAYAFTVGGCTPIANVALDAAVVFDDCVRMTRHVSTAFLRDHHISTVILMSRWTAHWQGAPFDNGEGGVEPRLFPGSEGSVLTGIVGGARTTDKAAIRPLYDAALDSLTAGARVVIVYPVPEAGWNVPRMIADRYRQTTRVEAPFASVSAEGFQRRNAPVIELFDSYPGPIVRVRPDRLLCNSVAPGRCITHRDGVPLYYDDDHLSDAGARMVIAEVLKALPAAHPASRR